MDLPKKPVVRIELAGTVVSGTVLVPGVIIIRVVKRALRRDVPRSVIMKDTTEQKFRILRAVSSDPNVSVSFDSSASAAQHTVIVKLSRTTGKTSKMVSATVRLFADNRKTPHILKVYYRVR